MTAYQFTTLKYIMQHEFNVTDAGNLSMVTFGSLIVRGWVHRSGSKLELTKEGFEAFESYSKGTANFRKHDTGLSPRVKDLLHLNTVRALREVTKAS